MENVKELLGKRIKELRKKRGMQQENLAEIIGIEPNNLSRIENGKNYPTAENLSKISQALGVNTYELFDYGHHKDYHTLKNELIKALNDEYYCKILYKFYKSLEK